MAISLTDVNVPYKQVTSAGFSELQLCLLFLKNNQLKTVSMPNRHIWGWYILLPFKLFLKHENS